MLDSALESISYHNDNRMTDKPVRRRMDDPEVQEAFIKKIAKATAEETVEKTVEVVFPKIAFNLFGTNLSTPEAITEQRSDMLFLRRARKVLSALFMTGLVGGIGWLVKGIKGTIT